MQNDWRKKLLNAFLKQCSVSLQLEALWNRQENGLECRLLKTEQGRA